LRFKFKLWYCQKKKGIERKIKNATFELGASGSTFLILATWEAETGRI
jgi:hypothetical protein